MTSPYATQLVVWLDIPVIELDRAINFYRSVFTVNVRDDRPQSPTATLQISNNGSGITLIQTAEPRPSSIGITPYLNCASRLEQAVASAQLNGGTILQAIHSMEPFGRRAVIIDSEGNRLALHSAE